MNDYTMNVCDSELKSVSCEDTSIKSRLVKNQLRLQVQLNTVNEALQAIEQNPELVKLLELINKAR